MKNELYVKLNRQENAIFASKTVTELEDMLSTTYRMIEACKRQEAEDLVSVYGKTADKIVFEINKRNNKGDL